MSTKLKCHAPDVSMNRFWGGKEDGSMVQVTVRLSETRKKNASHQFGMQHVELTREQAAALAADLLDFAQHRETEEWDD